MCLHQRCARQALSKHRAKPKRSRSRAAEAGNGEHRAHGATGNKRNVLSGQNSGIRVRICWTSRHLPPAVLPCCSRQRPAHCHAQFQMELSARCVLNFCDSVVSWLKVRVSALNQMRPKDYVTGNIQKT